MTIFQDSDDEAYFKGLFKNIGGIETNKHYFDFRNPKDKRAEFGKIRDGVYEDLVKRYGDVCQLKCHSDCTNSANEVDHLIPLSSNVLNKELRKIKGKNGKKTPSQSIGSNHSDNFVLACTRCNAFKKHRIPGEELLLSIKERRASKR